MSATDVILAGGPTVVALAAIGSAFLQQQRSLKHEREVIDLAAVRALLDEAAVLLHRAERLLIRRATAEIELLLPELEAIQQRLSVRLGTEHTTVLAFARASNDLAEWYFNSLDLARSEDDGGPTGDRREKLAKEVNNIYFGFGQPVRAYLDAAVKTAGARLP